MGAHGADAGDPQQLEEFLIEPRAMLIEILVKGRHRQVPEI
jgi:hypothetical protein